MAKLYFNEYRWSFWVHFWINEDPLENGTYLFQMRFFKIINNIELFKDGVLICKINYNPFKDQNLREIPYDEYKELVDKLCNLQVFI